MPKLNRVDRRSYSSFTQATRVEAQNQFLAKHPAMPDEQKQKLLTRHYDAYWLNVPLDQQLRHEALIARAAPRDVTTDVKSDAFAAMTEITIYAPDHPRLARHDYRSLCRGQCQHHRRANFYHDRRHGA